MLSQAKILHNKRRQYGYGIVTDFIDSQPDDQAQILDGELKRNARSPYCGDIIKKYPKPHLPIWAFVEIISFGRFVSFYKFCADRLMDQDMQDNHYLMKQIRDLRNAAAHNNCLLNDLRSKICNPTPNNSLMKALGEIGISKATRKSKMHNARIQQIVTLLYTHKKLVGSDGVHEHRSKDLHALISERMFRHKCYYLNNDTILTTFNFLRDVVDNWFLIEYNVDT